MELTESEARVREASLNTTKYKNKLADYAESFPHMLDEFKKYYIFFNKNPDVNEYQQMYSSMKANIQQSTSQVFVTTNEIQKNTDDLNAYILDLNDEIQKAKVKNTDLKKKLGFLNAENNTTGIMIDNYRESYNIQYFINFVILLGILFVCFFMYKTFTLNSEIIAPIKEIGEKVIEAVKSRSSSKPATVPAPAPAPA